MEQNEHSPSGFERFNDWRRNSLSLKLITIAILVLIMLIPVSLVRDLIRERQWRRDEAVTEVSNTWGGAQVINGPVLSIPFYSTEYVQSTSSNTLVNKRVVKYAHFLPKKLDIVSSIDPMIRKRGIYEILVYNSDISLEGEFEKPDFSGWTGVETVLWDGAFVSIGIPDMRAIRDQIQFSWNDQSLTVEPGVEGADIFDAGVSTKTPMAPESLSENKFRIQLKLGGNSSLQFIPLGKETNVHLTSTWSSPKFMGAFLPNAEPKVGNGFEADWKVLYLNRNFPQRFMGAESTINESAFGAELLIMVDEYQKNERSAKYAVMLIALTFLVFFFIQILNKVRIHSIQYILVGLALSLFYVLLLSLSEQIGFNKAYALACTGTIGLVFLYFKSITESWKLSGALAFIMFFIYGFIFVIIQLEDLALLAGSIGLFLILALVMYLSRKVDWYAMGRK